MIHSICFLHPQSINQSTRPTKSSQSINDRLFGPRRWQVTTANGTRARSFGGLAGDTPRHATPTGRRHPAPMKGGPLPLRRGSARLGSTPSSSQSGMASSERCCQKSVLRFGLGERVGVAAAAAPNLSGKKMVLKTDGKIVGFSVLRNSNNRPAHNKQWSSK